MSKQINLSNDLNNDFNEKLGYTQCFKIINGQVIPINMYAKIIVEPEHELEHEPDRKSVV